MASKLRGKKIAILATDGFEQVELTEPRKALDEAGSATVLIAPRPGEIRAWKTKEWGDSVKVDKTIENANPNDYDALVLPGGVMNPDRLRMDPGAVNFVRQFVSSGKPIGAICHGPWMLLEAGAVSGKTVTSWPSLKTDLKNAGANWVDQEVASDGVLITSRNPDRNPDDIPAFSRAIIDAVSRGVHDVRAA